MFVQNKARPRAHQLLHEHCVVIISGVPGIGKTTLAEMLLYAHLEDGYQPVVMQTDVAEGKRLFRQQSKQIFYYDDFLGQTFLGDQRTYLGSNHDADGLQLTLRLSFQPRLMPGVERPLSEISTGSFGSVCFPQTREVVEMTCHSSGVELLL